MVKANQRTNHVSPLIRRMNFRPRNDRCSRTIRRFAAHLLGDIKDPRGVLILVGLLHDQDVNSIVPCSLGEIGDRAAINALLGALDDGSPSLRVCDLRARRSPRERSAATFARTAERSAPIELRYADHRR